MKIQIIVLSFLLQCSLCRDFYVGMFKKNDLLVASDTLYKERVPWRLAYAKYGRLFNCTITYFRVVDRLGVGRKPKVQIIRGGLRKKYLVLRLISGYDLPLSVNIYVGCENKLNFTLSTHIIRRTTEPGTTVMKSNDATVSSKAAGSDITTAEPADAKDTNTEVAEPGSETTAAGNTEANPNADETTLPPT